MNEQASSRAVASLICGILAWTSCPLIGAVLAVVLGAGEKSGVGRAGVILGWIQLAIAGLFLLLGLAMFVTALVFGQ